MNEWMTKELNSETNAIPFLHEQEAGIHAARVQTDTFGVASDLVPAYQYKHACRLMYYIVTADYYHERGIHRIDPLKFEQKVYSSL